VKDTVKKETGKIFEHVNIALIGKSGSGKSTLVNVIFGCQLAEEGVGKAKTMQITEYPRRGEETRGPYRHLRLFDTRGIEVLKAEETITTVKEFLKKKNRTIGNERTTTVMKEHIHFVLYTVLASHLRFEEAEAKLIDVIKDFGIGVIIVMTKAIDEEEKMNELQKSIADQCPNTEIVRVLAKQSKVKGHPISPFGVHELVHSIHNKIPGQCHSAFAASQKVDASIKGKTARDLVGWITAGGAGLSFLPVGGVGLWYFLCSYSESVAKVFDFSLVRPNVTAKEAWMPVLSASNVCDSWSGKLRHIPFVGAVTGGVTASEYFDKLIRALEKLQERHEHLRNISNADIVDVIKDI
jgi:GTP-binding protein EngB required for normal cell division